MCAFVPWKAKALMPAAEDEVEKFGLGACCLWMATPGKDKSLLEMGVNGSVHKMTTELVWGCFWLQTQPKAKLKNQKPDSSYMCCWPSNANTAQQAVLLCTHTPHYCETLHKWQADSEVDM